MKKIKLTTQINFIFTIVTLLSSLIFFFVLNYVFESYRMDQNERQFLDYYDQISRNINRQDPIFESEHNGYIIKEGPLQSARSYNVGPNAENDVLNGNYTASELIDKFQNVFIVTYREEVINGVTYKFRVQRLQNNGILIVFTGENYMRQIGSAINQIMQFSFIAIVILGNLIILMWSRITVERIKQLNGEVEKLSQNQYKIPIAIEGQDEITELAKTIERMRREIEVSERTKQEMLQNISHDFKTPIAVIQSYAEAIADGISDIEEAKVIIKQAEMLNQKVKQLLELNKLEYLKDQSEFEEIRISEVIHNIVNNQKYRTGIQFVLELDQSTYFGVLENFYSVCNNIIDNALRYAKTKIIITLKNRKLSFYNDGEPISEKFIDEVFRPYEKGQKGQFGLGMSIVQKTLTHFNLTLKVENIDQGVKFTIEPL